jgi:hypothetical protein
MQALGLIYHSQKKTYTYKRDKSNNNDCYKFILSIIALIKTKSSDKINKKPPAN